MVIIWWLPFWKFRQFLPQELPKNAWMIMKLYENLKPNKIRIIYDNKHYCNKWLFRKGTKVTFFFQPSSKKVNFHWRFIRWRSRHRKNLIANFYDAVNSRFRIYKLLFQRKRKKRGQKSGKIWVHSGKNSCFASVFFPTWLYIIGVTRRLC